MSDKNLEYIGKNFGLWTVIGIDKSKKFKDGTTRQYFRCQCKCGNIKSVEKSSLITGKSKHCGCNGVYLKPGDQFNEWTVIKKSTYTNKHGNQFYLCECSCGIKKDVRMSDLTSGKSKNCGHSRNGLSNGAQQIFDLLTELNIKFIQEYEFKDLPKRRYDFAIIDDDKVKLLIEYDGQQHDLNSKSSWSTKELHQRDFEKNKFALNNNIPLVRTPWFIQDICKNDIFGEKYLVKEERYNVKDLGR